MADRRECPSCALEIDADADVCPYCGYELPRQNPHLKYYVMLFLALMILWLMI